MREVDIAVVDHLVDGGTSCGDLSDVAHVAVVQEPPEEPQALATSTHFDEQHTEREVSRMRDERTPTRVARPLR